jgi:hypothetical protein
MSIPEQFGQLLKTLKIGTEKDHYQWESLPDKEMFLLKKDGGLIKIGKVKQGQWAVYTLSLLAGPGPTQAIALELESSLNEPGYDLIEDLYTTVRLKAHHGTPIINSIINEAKGWKGTDESAKGSQGTQVQSTNASESPLKAESMQYDGGSV